MLNDFIAEVKRGALAKNNRYAVMFTPAANVNKGTLQKVLLFCDTVQLPGVNYSTMQNRTFGEFRETPYEKLYDNLAMTFYVDKDMQVKQLFDDWMSTIQDPIRRTFNYYDNYVSDMTIEIQDVQDRTTYVMNLWECYPKNIGSIQLDYANKDIMKLSVTMQYKYWTSTSISTLNDGQQIEQEYIDSYTQDFTGFQSDINRAALGERAGNFVAGSLGTTEVNTGSNGLRYF